MLGVVAPAQFPIAPLQKCQPKMWWTNVWKRHYWWFKVVLKAIKKKRNKHVTYGLCVMVLHITAPILIFSGPSLALLSPPSCWVPPVQEACNGDSRVAALHVHWLTEPRLNPPPSLPSLAYWLWLTLAPVSANREQDSRLMCTLLDRDGAQGSRRGLLDKNNFNTYIRLPTVVINNFFLISRCIWWYTIWIYNLD